MLESIPNILTWRNASEFHGSLLETHRTSLLEEYQERMALFLAAGIGTHVDRLSRELPQSSIDRILGAPETANILLFEPRTKFRHFLNAIVAEHALLGNSEVDEGVWTALFDYYIQPNEEGKTGTPCDVMAAPRLRNGIPIDLSSPQAEHTYFPTADPSLPLTGDEASIAKVRLAQALDAIAVVSPAASELIQKYVRVILLRKDAEAQALITCSYDHFTGKVGFVNVHLSKISLGRLMDGLVHEAIHSFLYMLEEGRPFFPTEEAANLMGLNSPWSGRMLRLHTFLHACYVWFGLWQFWKEAMILEAVSLPETCRMLDRARSGFFRPEMVDRIRELDPHLTRDAKPVIQLINDVRSGEYD